MILSNDKVEFFFRLFRSSVVSNDVTKGYYELLRTNNIRIEFSWLCVCVVLCY